MEWLLLRAFAAPGREAPLIDARLALDLTQRLGLATRIAGRTPRSVLQAELGATYTELASRHLTTAAADAMLLDALRLAARSAHAVGAPLIALKFAALRVLGVARAGQRRANDIDVLTSVAMAPRLRMALLGAGCSESGVRGYAHQLAPLLSPQGVPIEIHLHLPGVRLPGAPRFASADDLLGAGLVDGRHEPAVPSIELLAAHALAHGFLQNAGAPASHSLLCTLADLSDVAAASPGALGKAIAFVEPLFDADDGRVTAELLGYLEQGNLRDALRSDCGVLLRHALAARLDADYASALRLRQITQPLSDRPFPLALARALSVALLPTATEIETIYGAGMSRRALLARRLLRPMDLGLRLIAAGASRLTARR